MAGRRGGDAKTIDILEDEEIKGSTLLKLTAEEMKEMGVKKGSIVTITELLAQFGTPPGTPRPEAGGASPAAAAAKKQLITLPEGTSLHVGEVIGRGGSGIVHESVLTERSGPREVAVKFLGAGATEKEQKSFLKEI